MRTNIEIDDQLLASAMAAADSRPRRPRSTKLCAAWCARRRAGARSRTWRAWVGRAISTRCAAMRRRPRADDRRRQLGLDRQLARRKYRGGRQVARDRRSRRYPRRRHRSARSAAGREKRRPCRAHRKRDAEMRDREHARRSPRRARRRNYRLLRERGATVRKTIDLVIATFCLERGQCCCTTIATSTRWPRISRCA